jgi:DNA-binding NarL/FixJ family response regulator
MAPTPLRFNLLSARERLVVQMLAEGLSSREIALRLCRSEGTVKVHVRNIYAKLGVRRRVVLISAWRQWEGVS